MWWSHVWLSLMVYCMGSLFYATHAEIHRVEEVFGHCAYTIALLSGVVCFTLFYEITQRRWSSFWIFLLLYSVFQVGDESHTDTVFLAMYGFALAQSFTSLICMLLFMAMNVVMGFMEYVELDTANVAYGGIFVIMYFYLHFSSCI